MRTDIIYGRVAGNEGVGVTEHEAGKERSGRTTSNAFERTNTQLPLLCFQMCQRIFDIAFM